MRTKARPLGRRPQSGEWGRLSGSRLARRVCGQMARALPFLLSGSGSDHVYRSGACTLRSASASRQVLRCAAAVCIRLLYIRASGRLSARIGGRARVMRAHATILRHMSSYLQPAPAEHGGLAGDALRQGLFSVGHRLAHSRGTRN
jgi:hypothetical protein